MTAMFSGPTAEPLRPFPLHGQQPHSDRMHSYPLPARPVIDLPRPLEPRPTLHFMTTASSPLSSLPPAASASSPRRSESSFRSPLVHKQEHPDYRTQQTQSLPRLHDVLNSTSSSATTLPGYSSTGGGWSATAAPSPFQPSSEGYFAHTSHYAPHSYPPHEPAPALQALQGPRPELPALDTAPVKRHDSHTVPAPPFTSHPDSSREYDARREGARQLSAGSYQYANGVSSGYPPIRADEGAHRSSVVAVERRPSIATTPSGPESSKKYLGISEVPGEGSYHIYEGGFRIPTHVDGETVNPAWGLTKANKPRKRLAMACLDCREKKIKCEPGPLSCLQCEKAKRPCRKAPAHQSQSEPNTTPVWQNGGGSPSRDSATDPTPLSARESDTDSVNKRRSVEELSPSGIPIKKLCATTPTFAMDSIPAPKQSSFMPIDQVTPTGLRASGAILSWEEDPYAVEPNMTMHLLEYYFVNVNTSAYCQFPRYHFLRWVTSSPRKSQNERLVLYAMLAVGSLFADDRCFGFGQHCANIATEAIKVTLGRFNMPVMQTRLLLGMYHFAKGTHGLAWDYICSGIHTAMYLRYHTEQGCSDIEEAVSHDFALSHEQVIECRRRSFWSGFMMGRYCFTRQNIISPKDIFLRLPCSDETYERGLASNSPFHNNGVIDPLKAIITSASAVSPMAWQVLITVIWADVVDFINGAVNRSSQGYEEAYDRFYTETRNALHGWAARLPEQLHASQTHAERAIRGGYAGPFVSMHILYHLAWVKMSRFARHESIPKSVARNVRVANGHAHELLQIVKMMGAANRQVAEKEGYQATFTITSPFIGYAILAAIDVVGAGGLDSNLKSTIDLISCGLDCLRELGVYWSSAREQNKDCEKRYYQIHNVLKHPCTARSGCWIGREWGVDSPLEREFTLENDCIYGVTGRDYFDALKDDQTPHDHGSGAAPVHTHGRLYSTSSSSHHAVTSRQIA